MTFDKIIVMACENDPQTTTTSTTTDGGTTTTSTTTDAANRGACCVDGLCISDVTEAMCSFLGGLYLTDGSTCENDTTGRIDGGDTIEYIQCNTTTSTTTEMIIG